MSSATTETSPLLPAEWSKKLKNAAGGDGKLQKSEFKILLLGMGIRIQQAVLDEMFASCDDDGDGGVTIDELVHYIETLRPKTIWDGVNYTVTKTTSSIVWWFALAFHFAAWVGMTSFVFTEEGKHIRSEWGLVGAWFFFFGAVYFFKLLHDSESSKYDTMVQAKIILKNCVDKDSAFFDRKAGDDASMDVVELNAVLEEQGLYLPKGILKKIIAAIDVDKSGTITKDEILQFAKTQATNPKTEERQAAIHDAVIHTWGFWSLLCWFLGSILFLVAAHLNYAKITEPPLPKNTYLHLYGMGSVLYFLLAVCMIPMLQNDAQDYLESIDQIGKAFAHRRERVQGSAAKTTLFQSLGDQSDGNLDPSILYDVLIDEGVLVSYDTFLELFKAADTSGDGKLQATEFASFISNLHIDEAEPRDFNWQIMKRIPYTSSFFGWLMFFIGGIFYTLGSYLDRPDAVWWYFAGAVCYGLASGKSVFGTFRGYWVHFHAVEAGNMQLKAGISGNGSTTSVV